WSFIRVYYGLDTRAASLGCGALLGALYVYGLLPRGRVVRLVRPILAILGVLLAAQLLRNVGYLIILALHHGLAQDVRYAGFSIYFLTALGTTLLIWELVDSPAHLGHRLLSWAPLVAIGRISYGLYLWDGTLTPWLSHDSIGVDGWALVATRTALTFVAATASWFLIERRFRARRPAPSAVPSG
ncbi:MAG: hypothetical protein ACYDD7_24800, partial [Acidimicrobiales bacterium]